MTFRRLVDSLARPWIQIGLNVVGEFSCQPVPEMCYPLAQAKSELCQKGNSQIFQENAGGIG